MHTTVSFVVSLTARHAIEQLPVKCSYRLASGSQALSTTSRQNRSINSTSSLLFYVLLYMTESPAALCGFFWVELLVGASFFQLPVKCRTICPKVLSANTIMTYDPAPVTTPVVTSHSPLTQTYEHVLLAVSPTWLHSTNLHPSTSMAHRPPRQRSRRNSIYRLRQNSRIPASRVPTYPASAAAPRPAPRAAAGRRPTTEAAAAAAR